MQFAVSHAQADKILKKNRNPKRAQTSACVMSAAMLKIEILFVYLCCSSVQYHNQIFAELSLQYNHAASMLLYDDL